MPLIQNPTDPIWSTQTGLIISSKFGIADFGVLKPCRPPTGDYVATLGEAFIALPPLGTVVSLREDAPRVDDRVPLKAFSLQRPVFGVVVGAEERVNWEGDHERLEYVLRIVWYPTGRTQKHAATFVKQKMRQPPYVLANETVLAKHRHTSAKRTESFVSKRLSYGGPACLAFSSLEGDFIRTVRNSLCEVLSCFHGFSNPNLLQAGEVPPTTRNRDPFRGITAQYLQGTPVMDPVAAIPTRPTIVRGENRAGRAARATLAVESAQEAQRAYAAGVHAMMYRSSEAVAPTTTNPISEFDELARNPAPQPPVAPNNPLPSTLGYTTYSYFDEPFDDVDNNA